MPKRNFYITSVVSAFKFTALYSSPFFDSTGIIQFIFVSTFVISIVESYVYHFNIFNLDTKKIYLDYSAVYGVISAYMAVLALYAGGFFEKY